MKKRCLVILLWIAGRGILACHRAPDGKGSEEKPDTVDSGKSDTAESEETGETEDSRDTGETADSTDTGETTDSTESGDSSHTGETGETSDSETGSIDTEDTSSVLVDIDAAASLRVYADESGAQLGYPYVLGDVTGDGVDDLCFMGDLTTTCYCFRSPIPEGLMEVGEADFLVDVSRGQDFAAPGDVNGDGVDDLAFSDKVLLGPVEDLESEKTADVTIISYYDYYNYSLQDNPGDSDGDGVDDFLFMQSPSELSVVKVLLVFSNLESPKTTEEEMIALLYSWSGGASAFAGDTNGDGFDDIALGNGALFLGPVSGSIREPDVTFTSVTSLLHPMGDIDGDGYDDVVAEVGVSSRLGRVAVYAGPFDTEVTWKDALVTIQQEDFSSGDMYPDISSIGDQNGDSLPDLGYVFSDNSAGHYDAIFYFETPLSGSLSSADAARVMQSSGSRLRVSEIDGPADLQGDGISNDFLIGDIYNDAFAPHGGVGWVMLGGSF